MFKFVGLPTKLSYGQNVEVTVDPMPDSAYIQLWKCDEAGEKLSLLNMDIATPASGDTTLQFKIPRRKSFYVKRYPPGLYQLEAGARAKNGVGNGQSYFLKLS